jgi:hypothetical protein
MSALYAQYALLYLFRSDCFCFPVFFSFFSSRARRHMRGQALAWSEFAPQVAHVTQQLRALSVLLY